LIIAVNSPLANPEFRKLFAAQIIALVGAGLATVALSLLAYKLAGGNAAILLGNILAIKMVAYVVFAPIIGGVAHRFDRKRLLITLDLVRAAIVAAIPFVTEIYAIYGLVFLLSVSSAGFKPIFQSTIPDIIPDEAAYTRALAYSRLAYDLETLLSPALAGLALLFFSFNALFVTNSITFLISAALVLMTVLPPKVAMDRVGGVWQEITFGVHSYVKTPRLRGMLVLYVGVAITSALIIVNTVVYVRETLNGSDFDVAVALAAAGAGSMFVTLLLPKILDSISVRPVMLAGSAMMGLGLVLMYTHPDFTALLGIWFLIGIGWSMVQTPAGKVVNQSSSPQDRASYFSAQFSLTHACWMFAYPLSGQLSTLLGIEATALIFGICVVGLTILSSVLWPKNDPGILEHTHGEMNHNHMHIHDGHHLHENAAAEAHSHEHQHDEITHSHFFVIDDHHPEWPR
jgi:MFS family permease